MDRTVETVKTITAVERERVEVPILVQPRTAGEYAELLNELAARIDTGRLYERDLSIVTEAVNTLIEALYRRQRGQTRTRR